MARLGMRQPVEGNLVPAVLERLAIRLDWIAPARRRAVAACGIQ